MTIERPMFPPRAESVDSFSHHPAIGQPASQTRTGDSPKTFEALDLAQLRFVRCLVRFGLTLDEAADVVAIELDHLRSHTGKKRRRLTLVGDRLVPVPV
jgi:hypothetical protein